MRISTSMRWLVVVAGAVMLLAVVAACSAETVEVPGATVVVEKEVVKTVEVPGPERVVVKEVAGKNYVTDPSTGKVVVAPQYGGTITFARKEEPAGS